MVKVKETWCPHCNKLQFFRYVAEYLGFAHWACNICNRVLKEATDGD